MTQTKLTKKHILGYGLGDFGGSMTFMVMGSFLTRYYVNVALIDTTIIAAMTLVWKMLDVISNPVIGTLMDKSFAKSGGKKDKFRPWLLRAAPLVAITAVLVFTAPSFTTGVSRLVVIFFSYLIYELAYTIHSIPYGSLLSAMSGNDEERAALSSARSVGGMVGSTLPAVLFPLILSMFAAEPAKGYTVGILICAGIGLISCLLSYSLTEERIPSNPSSRNDAKFTDIFQVFKKNRAYLALCIHGLCNCAIQAISSALGTYLYSDVLGNLAMMSLGTVAVLPVSLTVLTVSPKISKKMGLERMIRCTLLIGTGLYVLLFALHVCTDVHIGTHIVLNAFANGFALVSGMMQWGMLGEAIDYNEHLTGKRTEGSMYGTFNMIRRVGQAVATSTCVAGLGWIGYDVSAANAGLAQSPSTIFGIKVLCVLMPAILALGSWTSFKFLWKIPKEDVR